MSVTAVQWCEKCKQFVMAASMQDPDKLRRFALSLLLCPIGFCMVPYVHPKLKPRNYICPICNELLDGPYI